MVDRPRSEATRIYVIAGLRLPARLTGESVSRQALVARLRRTPGLTLRNHLPSSQTGTAPSLVSRAALRPALATRAFLRAHPEVRVVWMVPSPGQIPLVSGLMWGLRNRAGFVVEGAGYGRYGDWWGAMRAMPAFFLLRAATTGDLLARLSPASRPYPVAVASQWQRDRLSRHLDVRRVHIIPNDSGGTARVPWSGGDGKTLRYLGHTLWYKGVDIAIDALSRLRSIRPGLRLEVASSIVDRRLGRTLAGVPGVTLLGEVDAAGFIAGADLLLLPLRTSSGTNVYPNVLIEAMAAGVPLLTSALPVHRELLGSTAAASTVVSYDPATWADRVDALLADSAARQRLGADLRARADEIWDPDAMDQRWTSFIDAIEAL